MGSEVRILGSEVRGAKLKARGFECRVALIFKKGLLGLLISGNRGALILTMGFLGYIIL